MRKRLSFVILAVFTFFYTQLPAQELSYSLNLKLGTVYTDKWEINHNLKEQNMSQIGSFGIMLGVGFEVSFKKIHISPFMNIDNYFSKEGGFEYNIPSVLGGITMDYEVLSFKDNKFKIGGTIAYGVTNLKIKNIQANVNMDDIMGSSHNSVYLAHKPLYLGADLKYDYTVNDMPAAISFGYWFNLNAPKWENQYGTTSNSIRESANRFNLSVYFPVYRK